MHIWLSWDCKITAEIRFLAKIRKRCKRFSSILNFSYMEGCIPPLLSSSEGDLILRNSSGSIRPLRHLSPLAPARNPQRMWICCSPAAGGAERGGYRPSHPPARHKHDVLCGNIKCILRTDRNVKAHQKCFHPLTRNKTHVRSQKAVFTLTNSAGCCLAVKDLPASPKAFLCQGNKHQPKWFYDFMKVFPSLSFSVVSLFFWSLTPETKRTAHWSLLVQIQLHLLRFCYHSNQDLSSFHGLWLNFLNSLAFSISQMSQLTLFWHIFQRKKDVKKPCHSSNWIFFFLLQCYNSVDKYWEKLASAPLFFLPARTCPVSVCWVICKLFWQVACIVLSTVLACSFHTHFTFGI